MAELTTVIVPPAVEGSRTLGTVEIYVDGLIVGTVKVREINSYTDEPRRFELTGAGIRVDTGRMVPTERSAFGALTTRTIREDPPT